jgi:phosphate transport system substrate-binding protein
MPCQALRKKSALAIVCFVAAHALVASAVVLVPTNFHPSASAAETITGAGATFPFPLYSKWFYEYKKIDPNVEFNYQSIGSGGGIRQVTEGTVDFGATDGPMTDEQLKDFTAKRGSNVLHFPTALGAAVPCYNVPGITQKLNFTPAALAGIFLGKITKWNDPELVKANPDVKLPNSDIVVVHRAESSGTTFIWADFLAKVSPEWKKDVGVATSLKWPVGLGAKGNEGVTGQVQQTPGSIGYVEVIYALQNKMLFGRVQNAAGKFVDADLASITAAGESAKMPDDFRASITNAPGEKAYPISSFTWLLIPDKISDAAKKDGIVKFLKWSLGEGQEMLEPLTYAKLPKEVVEKELKAIDKIK